jgi:hypothetical protein
VKREMGEREREREREGERREVFCIKPFVFEFSFGTFGIRTHDTLRETAPIALPQRQAPRSLSHIHPLKKVGFNNQSSASGCCLL